MDLKADPGIEPLREAGPLAERPQHLDALAVDQAEIAGALRQADLAEAREQAIEQPGEAALEPRLVGPVACAGRRP